MIEETAFTEEMARLEAILYASGNPMNFTELCAHLKLSSEKEVSDLVDKMSKIYTKEGSALELKKLPMEKVVLQLKSEYTREAKKFSIKPLLTDGPLKTLSFVAYNQPIEQKAVAQARGNHSYTHLRTLENMGLISREKKKRTKIIRTTEKFADYLGLSHNRSTMKRQLRRIFQKMELREL
jgi:segregation and condensation protein B